MPIDKYQYGDTSSNRDNPMKVRSYNFVEFALAPLETSRKINNVNNPLIRIKALNFLQGKADNNILSVKVYSNYISYYSYLLSLLKRVRYRKIYVAMLQYRHKYGTSPKRLELLVPEFLTKKDLYAVYDYQDWYSVKGNSVSQTLILSPLLMKEMNQYIQLCGYR